MNSPFQGGMGSSGGMANSQRSTTMQRSQGGSGQRRVQFSDILLKHDAKAGRPRGGPPLFFKANRRVVSTSFTKAAPILSIRPLMSNQGCVVWVASRG